MSERSSSRRIAALILAMMFTFVTVINAASVQAYAVSRPYRVTYVKPVAKSSSSIKVTWHKAKYAKKYEIWRATSKSGTYKKVWTTRYLYFTNKGLKSSKKYYYKVRGVNGTKKGRFSTIKYATTKKSSLSNITTNTTEKTVTINARVNGKYFKESTRHLIIDSNSGGFNAGKSILDTYVNPETLYNALVKVGGVSWSKSADASLKNGEKISKNNAENKNYSHMEVTVSWGNETHKLSEIVTKTAGTSDPLSIDMVFSGNPKAAAKTPSGCVVCLDSCYIGIVSNCKYGLCVIDKKNPPCYGNSNVLPKDGTIVKVTFKLK